MMALTRRQILRRWETLKNERSSFWSHWRELSEFLMNRRGRFLTNDQNKSRRNDKIINSSPRRALRVASSGMMAGITSPARPWFRLSTPDPEMYEYGPVRSYLHIVEERMRLVFAKSNLYSCLFLNYQDLLTFGISTLHVDEDDQDIVRGYTFPVGQYALATSARQAVDTVYREMAMTVAQLVERFGLESCSESVRTLYRRGQLDDWVPVLHVVQPNPDHRPGLIGPSGMPYSSWWLEINAPDSAGFLRQSGYYTFPIMAPRWEVNGEDVYGSSCPGMDALGDCKALQLLEKRKAQMIDKITTPPMVGPASLTNRRVGLLPGDVTTVDIAGGQKLEPAIVIPPQALPAIKDMIQEHETRVGMALYSDLWLDMIESDRRQITAREVSERHEEKMLQLGPVLERFHDEHLDPLIDRVYDIMDRRGYLPEPPPELQGVELRVEYISIMAQAQKLIATGSIERFGNFLGSAAQVRPDILDNADWDRMARGYADALGVPPDMVLSEDRVAVLRSERAKQQAQARLMEQMQQAAQSAKTLGDTSMEGDTALTRLMGGAVPGLGRV